MRAVGGLFLGLFTAAAAALYWFQDNLLYYPNMPPDARTEVIEPSEAGMPFEEVYIRTEDNEKCHGFFIKQDKCGLNILLVEYRGYGKSKGTKPPTEPGLKKDAEAALAYLWSRGDIDKDKIILFGRSLGGAVGLDLLAKYGDRFQGMIVENTFTSIDDMVDVVFPFLKYFKSLMFNHWRNIEVVKKITQPVLFLSGDADELVPNRMMHELHAACASAKKEIATFPHGTHNETWMKGGDRYWEVIDKFVTEVARRK